MSKRVQSVVGFHVSHDSGKIRGNRGITIVPGTTYKAQGRLKMCETGVHASFTLEEAMSFRYLKPGRVVSLVEITGDVKVGHRKVVGRNRKVLAMRRIDSVPPTEYKQVYVPGATSVVKVNVVKQEYIEKLSKDLLADYRKHKRSIDNNETTVILAE